MFTVILTIIVSFWLLGAVGSFICHALSRIGLITYPEVWVTIILLNLLVWPWVLYELFGPSRPGDNTKI